MLSRATLIGSLEKLDAEAVKKAVTQYNEVHGKRVGVDAVGQGGLDIYYSGEIMMRRGPGHAHLSQSSPPCLT